MKEAHEHHGRTRKPPATDTQLKEGQDPKGRSTSRLKAHRALGAQLSWRKSPHEHNTCTLIQLTHARSRAKQTTEIKFNEDMSIELVNGETTSDE